MEHVMRFGPLVEGRVHEHGIEHREFLGAHCEEVRTDDGQT